MVTQDVAKAIGLVQMRDLFAEQRWWSVRELSERLGQQKRTVERWLYDMDAVGCPLLTRQRVGCVGNVPEYRRMRLKPAAADGPGCSLARGASGEGSRMDEPTSSAHLDGTRALAPGAAICGPRMMRWWSVRDAVEAGR